MKSISGKKYTVKELATQFGCNIRTIQKHALKLFGPAPASGAERSFDEAQVTMILEKIKTAHEGGSHGKASEIRTNTSVRSDEPTLTPDFKVDLKGNLQGVETHLMPVLRLKLIQEQKDRLHEEEVAIYKEELARKDTVIANQAAALGRLAGEHQDALTANAQLWRIAESAGALTSDREDTLALYRRGRKRSRA
jgi:DNA-binding transcriptional MerR regulator